MPKKNTAAPQLQIQIPQDPISIKIVHDPAPPLSRNLRRALPYFIALTLASVFIVAMLWAVYVLPRERQAISFDPPLKNASVVIEYPKYLTKDDEGVIDIEIANQSDIPLNNAAVSVLFSEPKSISLAIGSSNTLSLDMLKSGAGIHQQFRVRFVESAPMTLTVRFTQESGVILRSTNSLSINASPLWFPLGAPLQQIVSISALLGLLSILAKWIIQFSFRGELNA
ncbi:MAG: hypothetical protein FJ009_14835 [Chloroflexi bacterium]|nr:hypothetical protein [Chloroflexota bacterium]